MKKTLSLLALTGSLFLACTPPAAAQSVSAGRFFSQGHTDLMATAGTGYALDRSYLVLGIGAAYYLLDGLNVGLSVQGWFGNDPKIYKVTPSVEYVFYQFHSTLKPYVGAFARRSFISDLPDLNSYGARAGFYVPFSSNALFGLGLVHEAYTNCEERIYRQCDSNYVEASLRFSF